MKEIALSQVIGNDKTFNLTIEPNDQVALVDDVQGGELELRFEVQESATFAYVLNVSGDFSARLDGEIPPFALLHRDEREGYDVEAPRKSVRSSSPLIPMERPLAVSGGREAQVFGHGMPLGRSISVVLAGKSAHANVRCLLYGDAACVFKIKTIQEHVASNATSNVVIKAVLDGEARLDCRSMIKVLPGANGTNAEQVNKNILLSSGARAVSIPMLEVLANDVKCKHGAAVSRLNDEQAFYLQSRGICPVQTRAMLLEAFLT